MTNERWASVWHQVAEVLSLTPEDVLEVGPGPGVFKGMAEIYGAKIVTVDWDISLQPDCVGDAEQLPFNDRSFDIVVSFQTVEHLPYERALRAVGEMARLAKRAVVVSVPDCRTQWRIDAKLPLVGKFRIAFTPPKFSKRHQFDGQHYWEVGKKGYSQRRIIDDFESKGLRLSQTYRVPQNPYHRFFVFDRKQ